MKSKRPGLSDTWRRWLRHRGGRDSGETLAKRRTPGRLCIVAGGKVESENGAEEKIEGILGTRHLGGRDAIDLLFGDSDVADDRVEIMRAVLIAAIGDSSLVYELNAHHLVTRFTRCFPGGRGRILELDWKPIVSNHFGDQDPTVDEVQVSISQLGVARQRGDRALRRDREATIFLELFESRQFGVDSFIDESLESIDTHLADTIFGSQPLFTGGKAGATQVPEGDRGESIARTVHTMKGVARTLGLIAIADRVHGLEDALSDSRDIRNAVLELRFCLKDYRKVLQDRFGGSAEDDRFTLGDLVPLIERDVRRLAVAAGKPVPTLNVLGGGVWLGDEIHRDLLRILSHGIGNCLYHGIESASERRRLGKSSRGSIQVACYRDKDLVCLDVSDDGRGLDMAAIRERAIERHIVAPNEQDNLKIANAVFAPKFTTASSVSKVAGRGVGMDAIKTLVKSRGGDARIQLMGEGAKKQFQVFRLALEFPLKAAAATKSDSPSQKNLDPAPRSDTNAQMR